MRVLIGTSLGLTTGGLTSYVATLSETLQRKGMDIRVVHPDECTFSWKFKAAVKALGSRDRGRINLAEAKARNVLEKVKNLLKNGDIALIHANDVLLASAMANLRCPMILTVHGPLSREAVMLGKGSPQYLEYLKEKEARAYQTAKAIIAVDNGQKNIMVEDYGVNPEKIHVIHNAVDTDLFSPQNGPTKVEHPYFLVPRRLVRKNGVDIAINAFSLVEDSEMELWIAGGGPEEVALKQLTASLGLTDRVHFLGSVPREKMVTLMDQAWGVIIPSVPVAGVIEATSIAALEGMSMGKPVFASAIGGLAEIITHGRTGYLFEAGSSEGLAYLLNQTVREREKSLTLGNNARQDVVRNHGKDSWSNKVLAVYQQVVGGK